MKTSFHPPQARENIRTACPHTHWTEVCDCGSWRGANLFQIEDLSHQRWSLSLSDSTGGFEQRFHHVAPILGDLCGLSLFPRFHKILRTAFDLTIQKEVPAINEDTVIMYARVCDDVQ